MYRKKYNFTGQAKLISSINNRLKNVEKKLPSIPKNTAALVNRIDAIERTIRINNVPSSNLSNRVDAIERTVRTTNIPSSNLSNRVDAIENSILADKFSNRSPNKTTISLETASSPSGEAYSEPIDLCNRKIRFWSSSGKITTEQKGSVLVKFNFEGVTGPPGPKGPTGSYGPSWKCGYGNPNGSLHGITGDLYVDLFNGEIWNNTGLMPEWLRTSLICLGAPGPTGPGGPMGPKGFMGPRGKRGPSISSGIGFPSPGEPENPIDGDTYVNREDGNFWIHSASKWYLCNEKILGSTGPTGPVGPGYDAESIPYICNTDAWEGDTPKTLSEAIDRIVNFLSTKGSIS